MKRERFFADEFADEARRWRALHFASESTDHWINLTTREAAGLRIAVALKDTYSRLMSMVFSALCASADFGNTTVRTPLLKVASIFSSSMLVGTRKDR